MLQHARRAVEAGDARCVLLLAGDRLDADDFVRLVDEFNTATRDHLAPIPTGGPNALFALLTQRHMALHGLGREVYGRIVVSQRAWAAANPGAVYRTPLTLAEYLDGPMVADPLTIYDCVPVVAGADAVVVSDRGGRRRCASALSASHNADHQEGDGLETGLRARAHWQPGRRAASNPRTSTSSPSTTTTRRWCSSSWRTSASVDGDLERLVDDRIASRALAVNTSGGQLSAGQAGAAGGMHGLVEIVRQLRGVVEVDRQVAGARIGVATGLRHGGVPPRGMRECRRAGARSRERRRAERLSQVRLAGVPPSGSGARGAGASSSAEEIVADGVVEEVTTCIARRGGRGRAPLVLGEVLVGARLRSSLESSRKPGNPVRLGTQAGAVLARHATCNDAP